MDAGRSRRGARASLIAGSLAALAFLGGCGTEPTKAAATSLSEVLGMDGDEFREREAKVQEEVRKCMDAEGFEYVPSDPSQFNVQMVGPGSQDNAEFRRTKGYGITTTFGDRPEPEDRGSDPNQKIREALGEDDREAYDKALFGRSASHDGGDGNFAVRIGPGADVGAADEETATPDLADAGCFGQAQQKVGGGNRLQRIGPKLQELQERIASDPRVVKVNAAWSTCMTDAGYDFETPEDIPAFLFAKLQELQDPDGADDDDGGGGPGGGAMIVPPMADSPELATLQQEELALALADDTCSEKTDRRDMARKVRDEAEKRFLEDNPDLGDEGSEGDGAATSGKG